MFFVMMSSMSWGTSGILQAFAPAGAHPLTVGAVRVVFAGFFLAAYMLVKGDGVLPAFRKTPLVPLLITVTGVMGYQFAFFTALTLTGVSIGSMIAIGASPIVAGVFGALFEREPLSGRWAVSTLVAITGCVLLLGGGSSGSLAINWTGAALALLAAFCYALLGLGMKRLAARLSTAETATVTTVASLCAFGPSWIFTPRGFAVASALGVLTEALPMFLYATGLRMVYLRDAYVVSLVEPLTACLLSALLLGERLTPVSLAGAAFILCGVLMISPSSGGEPQPE
jgi:DME family drug/metabolite transporter